MNILLLCALSLLNFFSIVSLINIRHFESFPATDLLSIHTNTRYDARCLPLSNLTSIYPVSAWFFQPYFHFICFKNLSFLKVIVINITSSYIKYYIFEKFIKKILILFYHTRQVFSLWTHKTFGNSTVPQAVLLSSA